MRIISGKYKGRKINPGKKFKARPTTDFAKESLFNILANTFDLADINVLDLFAGTGSISLEFASRGCKEVDIVEKDNRHYKFIREIINSLSIKDANLHNMDVFRYLTKIKKQYDIIFADPPYDHLRISEIPDLIFSNQLLRENGCLIIEHSSKTDFSSHFNFTNLRKYGSVNFSFFEK